MKTQLLVIASLLGLLLPVAAAAQHAPLPRTPAGERAAALLEVVMNGDAEARRAFIETAWTADLRDRAPMEEHLAVMDRVAHDLEESERAEVRSRGETGVDITFRLDDGSRLHLTLDTEPEPPHRVSGLSFRLGPPEPVRFESFDHAEEALSALARDEAFSGVVIAGRGDEIAFHRAYGMADRTAGRPVDLDTRFDIGSLDKLFTSVAILRLAEAAMVDLDAPVGRYLERLDAEVLERVTVRHLLQHTGGLGDYLGHPEFRGNPGRFRTTDDFLDLVRGETLLFEPGTDGRYSNSGFVVLGAIIEAVTERPYHEVVREMVLEPAGMIDTGPHPDHRSAVRYAREHGRLVDGDRRWPSAGSPAGGGYSTARDLYRFMAALYEDRLLPPAATDLLLGGFRPPPGGELDRSRMRIGFGGGAPGLNADVTYDGSTGRIVAVVANLDPPIADRVSRGMLDMEW
jgi:D-alanyl-D-alanine carboxypeptidase